MQFGNVSVVGLAGDFSLIRMRDTNIVNEEAVVVTTPELPRFLTYDFDGQNESVILTDNAAQTFGLVRGSSGRTYYTRHNQLFNLPFNGTTGAGVLTVADGIVAFDVNSTETRAAVIRQSATGATLQVHGILGGTGSSFTWAGPTSFFQEPRFLDDGNIVAFLATNDLYVFNPFANQFQTNVANLGPGVLTVHRSSNTLVHVSNTGLRMRFFTYRLDPAYLAGVQLVQVDDITVGGPSISDAEFAPDGKTLVLLDQSGNLYSWNLRNQFLSLIRTRDNGVPAARYMSVGIPPLDRLLVHPTSGLFGTAAAGIMVTQAGDVVKNYVMWDATTRSTSRLFDEAGSTTNAIFRVEADRITRLSYTNDNQMRFLPTFPTTTVVNGALVSYNVSSGKVVSVMPYQQTRSGSKPTVSVKGDTVQVTGELLGVFDAAGKNLAPNGTQSVKLDRAGISVQ
jgi:hypothetical protein